MSYVTVFGGQNVNPAMLSYAGYTITATLNLVWSFEAVEGSSVAAAKLDITSNGSAIVLPPANQVSVGQDVLIKNVGATTFVVFANDGTTSLGTIASGEAWYFYLTDNSTAAGVWDAVQFGAGTSNANAAALAGKGLVANVTKLDQNLLTDNETTGLTIDLTRKARVVQNEGGTVVWAFDPAATLGDGFFVYVINAGTGTVTLAPDGAELIDGALTKLLQPNENCIVFCDGTSFHTLGYGRVLVSEVTGDSINVSGTGDYVLSDTERDAQVQDFTGTLTGARTVTYGNVVGYWFVYNNTSGAYTLTARCDNLDPGAVLTQGFFTVIRSNGTNMEIAFTDAGGTVTGVSQVAGETVATPNPIITSGTIGLANTAVTPGTYGTAARTVTATFDQKGRATAASDQLISIPISQVQVMTSAELAARVSDETGTGALVFGTSPSITTPTITNPTVTTGTFTSPTMITPTLGVATATSINGLTIIPTTGTFDLANAKTLNVDNTLNMTGADGSNINFVGGGSVMYGQAGQSNFLAANVNLLVDGTYYNGPQLTLGSGTFFVSGNLVYADAVAGARSVYWKLTDGTTIFASGSAGNLGGGAVTGYAIPYCGIVSNPVAAVVIQVATEPGSGIVSAYLAYNQTGNAKDCNMFAFRIGY